MHTRHIELQMAITERLSQAVEKAWRIEQLEEANHAYTQMLAFVSHELKSPVASMVTDAQLLGQRLPGRPHTPSRRPSSRASRARASTCSVSCASTSTWRRVEGSELRLDPRSRVDVRRRGRRTRPSSSCGRSCERTACASSPMRRTRARPRSSAATPRCCASCSSTCWTTPSSTATRAARSASPRRSVAARRGQRGEVQA